MTKFLVPGVMFFLVFACVAAEAVKAPAVGTAGAPAAATGSGAKQSEAADTPKHHKHHSKADSAPAPSAVAPAASTHKDAVAASKSAFDTCTADVSNKTILAGQSFMLTLTPAPAGTTGSKAYAITTPPRHGTLGNVTANGQVEYAAGNGYSGDDTFSYTVANASQSPVAIKICPVATDDTWRVADAKTPTTGTLSAKGSNLTYILLDKNQKAQTATNTLATDHGSIAIYPSTGQFTYAPKSTSYIGPDTFQFQVQSGSGNDALVSANATETVIFGSWPPCESVDSYASRSTDALTQMAKPGGNNYNPDCADRMTAALRRKASILNKEIMNLQGLRDQPMSDDKLKSNNDQIQADNAELQQIEALGISPNDLVLRFRDYPVWYTYFFGGIAFTSIDKLFQNGTPMIGLNIDHRFYDWFHVTGVIEVTSAAESQLSDTLKNQTSSTLATTPTTTPAPSASTQSSGHSALDVNLQPYLPFLKYGDDSDPGRGGPIALFGLRKRDGDPHFTFRRYLLGYRDAFNPDTYIDVLYGRTMGLDGNRVEVRAQMPLPFGTFNNDSRFFIGAVANVHWRNSSYPDSVVIYLTWNLPFQKLTGVTSSAASQ